MMPIWLECNRCWSRVDEEDVELIDIEEGERGEDIVTYSCPHCLKVVKSRRLG
jgi:hypothetical protein